MIMSNNKSHIFIFEKNRKTQNNIEKDPNNLIKKREQ